MAKSKKSTVKSNDNAKVCAILAYLLVGIIWYFADETMRKDKFVKFHVQQAIALLIVSIAGQIILSLIWFIGWILMPLFGIFILILWIIGLINAANNKEKELPIIGPLGKKFDF